MLAEALCVRYGSLLCEIDGQPFHSFPTVAELAVAHEADLRVLGFGYRAKYVIESAQQIQQKGSEAWLLSLRTMPLWEARMQLLELMGIGRKVADCICLFSLDKMEVVPVDTHIWQIAQTYMPGLKSKSLTDGIYQQIGEFFLRKFGPLCGWAHMFLFASDLSIFKQQKQQKVVQKQRNLGGKSDVRHERKKARSSKTVMDTPTVKMECFNNFGGQQ